MAMTMLEDFSRKDLWYRVDIGSDGTLGAIEVMRSRKEDETVSGKGFRAKFRAIFGQFVALYRLPVVSNVDLKSGSAAAHQILRIGDQIFDLDAENVKTTFHAGLIFRSFSVAVGEQVKFSLKYWPPFHWTTFDGDLYKYYDLFWQAHIANHKMRPI